MFGNLDHIDKPPRRVPIETAVSSSQQYHGVEWGLKDLVVVHAAQWRFRRRLSYPWLGAFSGERRPASTCRIHQDGRKVLIRVTD
jgi:hypothetical protein